MPTDGLVPIPVIAEERSALDYMGFAPGRPIASYPVDVVFIGS